MGLTAAQFDLAVFVSIVAAAAAIWLFVFDGTTTARDLIGLEKPITAANTTTPDTPAIAQQAPEAAAAPPVEAAAPPAPVAPPVPVISPEQQALIDSAQALINDVESFRGRFQVNMVVNGETVNSGGDMVFQAPDRMHMTMNVAGQTFEMLALPPDMYIRIPNEGWYYLSAEALGFSPAALDKYVNNRGLFDYEAQAQLLAGVTQAPDEYIDGVAYQHLVADLDFQSLFAALPSDLFDPAALKAVQAASGPVHIDILIDKETHLPRRQTMSMDLNVDGNSISMDMRMAVTEYNGDVVIPAAPEDARPLEALQAPSAPIQ
jgi:hypothetical protein